MQDSANTGSKPSLNDLRINRPPESASRSKGWLFFSILFLVLLAFAAVWFGRSRVPEVQTALAREDAATRSSGASERTVLNGSGYVTARRLATVSAKLTGKVVEVLVEEGLKVHEGQIVARLDDSNVRGNLRLAEAQLEVARSALQETTALLRQAEREYSRITNLVAQRITSPSDLDKAEADAASLKARLARQMHDVTVSERQVAIWQQQVEDHIIRAPFTGIVTTKAAQPGEMISPVSAGGGFTRTGICTIVDMASLEIEVDVNESYINRVVPRQPVEAALDAYPEWKIPCKVIAIIPTADRNKSTVKVRVGFDHLDDRILPDMSAKVEFHAQESPGTGNGTASARRAVIIPKAALQQDAGKDYVLLMENGRVERRTVTVIGSRNDEVTLSAGVNPGERVILGSHPGLVSGSSVKEKKP